MRVGFNYRAGASMVEEKGNSITLTSSVVGRGKRSGAKNDLVRGGGGGVQRSGGNLRQ